MQNLVIIAKIPLSHLEGERKPSLDIEKQSIQGRSIGGSLRNPLGLKESRSAYSIIIL